MRLRVISEFCLKRQVHFYETDAAGIVHFSVFFSYVEEAEHAMWRAAGLSIAPPNASVGFPRVAANFAFLRPLYFEDAFEVHLRITRKSSRSLSYGATIEKDGNAWARGTLTIACVQKLAGGPMQSATIPAEIANAFEVATPEAVKG